MDNIIDEMKKVIVEQFELRDKKSLLPYRPLMLKDDYWQEFLTTVYQTSALANNGTNFESSIEILYSYIIRLEDYCRMLRGDK